MLSLMLILVGCTVIPPGEEEWVVRHVEDEGRACLLTGDDPDAEQTFDAETPIEILVHLDRCGSYSCSRNPQARCEVTVEGDTITIQAEGEWEDNIGATLCYDDCGWHLEDDCSLGMLEEGTYTVVYGGSSMELTVPGTQLACMGDSRY